MKRCGAVVAFFCVLLTNAVWASPQQTKERLNQIFYWRLADELKLSAEQEQKMKAVIEDFQKRREGLLNERGALLEQLKAESAKSDSKPIESAALLKRFRTNMESLGRLDSDELQALEKLFGPQLLVRFLTVREEVTARVREALIQKK